MLIVISASCDIAAIHALLYFIFIHNHFVSSAEHTNIHPEKNKTFNHGWIKVGSQSKMVDQHYSVIVGWYVRIQNAGWSWWHSEDCSRREVAMLSVELRKNDIPNMNHSTLVGKSLWRQIILPTQSSHTPASISSLTFRSVSFVLNVAQMIGYGSVWLISRWAGVTYMRLLPYYRLDRNTTSASFQHGHGNVCQWLKCVWLAC